MKPATLNTFVKKFLSEHDEALVESWMETDNQKRLKSLINRSENVAKKDPDAPKRAKSAYLFFCDDQRAAVKKSLGDEAEATAVTKQLGVLWKELKGKKDKKSLAAMQKYVDSATEDKSRYETEKSSYVPSDEFLKTSRKSGKKDPLAPKRAQSAYLYFCAEERDNVKKSLGADAQQTDVTRELGSRWNALKEKGAQAVSKYNAMAHADAERYKNEKAQFDSSRPQAATDVQPTTSKRTTKKSVTIKDEPVAPKSTAKASKVVPPKAAGERKTTAYQAFCSEQREAVKAELGAGVKPAEVTKALGARWKALSDEDKQLYSDMASS